MDIQFSSSELGTKEHWDKSYNQEFKNFERHGDVGDMWYGEDSILRLVKWMTDNLNDLINSTNSILDIGCGNGMVLNYLADEGFQNLFGIDYSHKAISLATSVASRREVNIIYEVADILEDQPGGELLSRKYDICIDRGTYDAISLSPNDSDEKMKSYVSNVSKRISDKGFFIITSCNWIEKELLEHFQNDFVKFETIPAPIFYFAGKIGTKYTCIVVRKKSDDEEIVST